jgi:diguanylate cyclase (GGDEF)-like protein
MKRLIFALAIVLGCASVAWAAVPPPLTSLHAVRALTNEEARSHLPVAFEGTVTYFRPDPNTLFVQDGDEGIYILLTTTVALLPGDRVLVRGIMQPSFRPIVESHDVTVLRHVNLPKPLIASYNGLVHLQFLCKLVTVRAVVQSADMRFSGNVRNIYYLHLMSEDGSIEAAVQDDDGTKLPDLLDAEVEVTGVAAVLFDSKMQQTGVVLNTNSLANIKVLKRTDKNPWTLPVTPMDTILADYRAPDQSTRVRIHGTITYYLPGEAAVLEDGVKSMWIATDASDPLQIGDVADATGFPEARKGFLNLVRGEIRDSGKYEPIVPQPAVWRNLATNDNIHPGHIYDLVSIEGQVMTEAREAAQDEYVLNSEGHLFTAIYHHSDKASLIPLPPMKEVPIGARVRVSGICVELNAHHPNSPVPFNILLRNFDDIEVIASPSLLNVRNLTLAVGLLLFLFLAVFARGWQLERKVRRQTSTLAQVERLRGRILVDINGSRPLTEIIEEITGLVSFQLNGVSCWCEIADGARLGDRPSDLTVRRIAHCQVSSRTGAELGTIFAAMDPITKPSESETDCLSLAAGLATLAIETRRLYNDLIHRSEFDLLTDIHNRFSLEKRLDAQIQEARGNAGIFGLIYIDLDGFKQVNDLYGHHIGDLYLQEVTERMKSQLRTHDLLARLGGDEFAVLLPMVRNRAGVEEIAQRLEACFDTPLTLEGHTLQGSASFGIALYPEDNATGDGLLSAADAAMYKAKNAKKQIT